MSFGDADTQTSVKSVKMQSCRFQSLCEAKLQLQNYRQELHQSSSQQDKSACEHLSARQTQQYNT